MYISFTHICISYICVHTDIHIYMYTVICISSQGKARQWWEASSFISPLVILLPRDPALFEHIVAYLEGTAMALPENRVCDHPLPLAVVVKGPTFFCTELEGRGRSRLDRPVRHVTLGASS